MKQTVFMFSGQGSQYYQMGKELFDENEIFRDWMIRLDNLVHDIAGYRVMASIYSGKTSESFISTSLTHPAIFMVEYSLAQCVIHKGVKPDCTLGASLGSFAAAAIAGHISVENAMAAVLAQAAAFEASCESGGMTAVLATPELYEQYPLRDRSAMAAINFDNHFSISARRQDLDTIEAALKALGVTHQRLPVEFPYHSEWIEPARSRFDEFMRSTPTVDGKLPLVCCYRAERLSRLPDDFFWQAVREPIKFKDTITCLEAAGPHRYVDVGPSGTLSTFVAYGLPKTSLSTTHAIMTPFGREQQKLDALVQLDCV